MAEIFQFTSLRSEADYLAPDLSEIRLLPTFDRGGLCHCTLPAGETSVAKKHKTVEEIWYCISGRGIIWQKNASGESEKEFTQGDSFTIPAGNSFQFRNNADQPLCIIISTMPKWPGPDEALDGDSHW